MTHDHTSGDPLSSSNSSATRAQSIKYTLHPELKLSVEPSTSDAVKWELVEVDDADVMICAPTELYEVRSQWPDTLRVSLSPEADSPWPELADEVISSELISMKRGDHEWARLSRRILNLLKQRRVARRLTVSQSRVEALKIASQAFSELHDEADILARLVEVVGHHLQSDRVSILRVFPELGELRMVAARGIPAEVIERARPKIGEGIAGRCAACGEPIFIYNHQQYRDRDGGVVSDQEALSGEGELPTSLTIPILVKGEVVGVVNVTGRADERPYSSSEVAFLSALMSHAGYLMESSRLIERQRELQRFSEQVIHTLSDPLVVFNTSGDVLKSNRRFIEVCGEHERLEGELSALLFGVTSPEPIDHSTSEEPSSGQLSQSLREQLREHLREHRAFSIPNLQLGGLIFDARLIPFEGDDPRSLFILHDITTRQQMSKQLLSAEKMASLGILAAGVAHEINNPLGFVKTNTKEAGRYFEDLFEVVDAWGEYAQQSGIPQSAPPFKLIEEVGLDEVREDVPNLVRESLEGLERIQKITASLKSFAHPDTENTRDAQLSTLVENALTITKSKWRHTLTIDVELPEHPPVSCIPSQLEQVFMNLVVNAAQAAQSRDERSTMKIGLELDHPDEPRAVTIRFADRCGGIPEAVVERIFDPFFTTKDIGEGTGLGLHIAHNIIEGHGGRISVESRPPEGTTFVITLPLGVKQGPLVIKQLSRFKA